MRDGKPRVIQCLAAKHQQVKIEGAWPPVLQPFSPVGLFNGLELVKQRMRGEPCRKPGYTINKIRLVLWADRAARVKRRLCNQCGIRQSGQFSYSFCKLGGRIPKIAAEANKSIGSHQGAGRLTGLRRRRFLGASVLSSDSIRSCPRSSMR